MELYFLVFGCLVALCSLTGSIRWRVQIKVVLSPHYLLLIWLNVIYPEHFQTLLMA